MQLRATEGYQHIQALGYFYQVLHAHPITHDVLVHMYQVPFQERLSSWFIDAKDISRPEQNGSHITDDIFKL